MIFDKSAPPPPRSDNQIPRLCANPPPLPRPVSSRGCGPSPTIPFAECVGSLLSARPQGRCALLRLCVDPSERLEPSHAMPCRATPAMNTNHPKAGKKCQGRTFRKGRHASRNPFYKFFTVFYKAVEMAGDFGGDSGGLPLRHAVPSRAMPPMLRHALPCCCTAPFSWGPSVLCSSGTPPSRTK